MRPITPRGFRDVLFEEAAERRAVTASMAGVFESYGFRFVETPVVEEYRTLEAGAGFTFEGTAFRMVDLDGSLLALRPEMTLPMARLAASRLVDERGPHRLCYSGAVFREQASLRGEARQFTQVGIELLGVNGPASDAEVVSVLVDTLNASGLAEFTVGIGTVAVLRSLLDVAGMGPDWTAAVMTAAHDRNLVTLDRLSMSGGVPSEVGALLRRLVRIGGGREAIEECRRLAETVGCGASLASFEEAWELLEAAGVTDRIRVDFGILRSFDYYTGLIIEAYAPGLGLSLGGGGRYDDVLGAFGAPMPAAGFALSLERVMIALAGQGVTVPVRGIDAIVGGDAAESARLAARLRSAGWQVRMSTAPVDALEEEAVSAGAACWIVAGADEARLVGGGVLPISPIPATPAAAGGAR